MYGVEDLTKTEYDENKLFSSIVKVFRDFSHNGQIRRDQDPVHDLDVYITYESIRRRNLKMANSKGMKKDAFSFPLRFYNVLSMGKLMKRIYLPQFMVIIHPLIFGNSMDKNYFAFRLYDGDNDGVIGSADLADFHENVLHNCPV